MTSFFGVGGNPFTTPVGLRIEQATDRSLASENWALNMEICDIINDTEDGPKDAIKALRKRLQQNAGKDYTVVMYSLTVLETCVKNCGKRFHILVCNKEFIQELVKLIGPKNDPPTAVQEKVLSLIQSWADAFRNQPDVSGVVQVYHDLKSKGIEFPMTNLDTMAPIHTPQRSIPDGEVHIGVPALVAQQQGTLSSPATPRLTPEQLSKLHADLDVVQANMAVLSEMMSELTPGKEHPSDIQLLNELHTTCKAMQHRLVELISKLANDEVTAELLRVNDLLNNIFLRYSRFENNREAIAKGIDNEASSKELIDFTDGATGVTPKLNKHFAGLSMNEEAVMDMPAKSDRDESEFDMFAQSRKLTYENSKTGSSTYEANLKPDQMSGGLSAAVVQARSSASVHQTATSSTPAQQTAESLIGMHKESDFDEMAAWLGEEASVPQESLTSSEFERFLAERAAAAEATPSPRNRRQNKEPEEASLFAL
uniref:VHS domain-containing protein n=1 Tax=Clastoptera arizonana TaxID=38151 RepID=A0A1B6CYU7_9HEMI